MTGEMAGWRAGGGFLVVGQVGRDLALLVEDLPQPGGSRVVHERLERLGGKAASQAVGLRQLGADPVALIGVVGEDDAGRRVLDEAVACGRPGP